ncbi:MAG: hypothetical protein J0I65_18575 [Variovorax sp.]|nr:hypothetical protein [Variovorax sp.]
MSTARLNSPFVGLLAHPCGVWVRVVRFNSGGVWGQPLHQMTRRGVLGRLA